MQYIDVTPTWRAVVPILIAALRDGTDEGHRAATAELYRMADIIDRMNEGDEA